MPYYDMALLNNKKKPWRFIKQVVGELILNQRHALPSARGPPGYIIFGNADSPAATFSYGQVQK